MSRRHVVVVGGGYAGLTAARRLTALESPRAPLREAHAAQRAG